MSAMKTAWLAVTWIPRGIPKAVANEISAIGQAFAHPEALARVALLESQGKNPWVVAKEEHRQMFLATLPYRFRMMVTEYEACKEKLFSGKLDVIDFVDLAYLLVICYIMWMLGEMFGRGSIWGYRFDGEIHRQEAANAILYQEEEAKAMEVVAAKLEEEINAWIKKMEEEEAKGQ
mmetsp:Transcript_5234/g.9331  ORF Transcript_5234/g.9331 Transcript_5234/m.9331 type:complete len:176 (-) Transcript_5234:212-739(-)|eukprot:CAMPEP_0174294970 /NCGR_PEP_ID=MMETSP0809-20121228/43237_1 /TAXON_ID=73025 ORGANISM="Eutreptiella gymnastica-like, Strain CCMP1594" /NCGR_SAMPLE_ID=MMETSP0809 /ASSEMBLY_ACC=CAM_ASM_000658 /LENGTH=175 /DNA_ID=CAMNT_0015396843 /DNA_START=51 /DNA_END=578 /DNA_ORIENTATION=+